MEKPRQFKEKPDDSGLGGGNTEQAEGVEGGTQKLNEDQINTLKFLEDFLHRRLQDLELEEAGGLGFLSEPMSESDWDRVGREIEDLTGENLDFLYEGKEGGWRYGPSKERIIDKIEYLLKKHKDSLRG